MNVRRPWLEPEHLSSPIGMLDSNTKAGSPSFVLLTIHYPTAIDHNSQLATKEIHSELQEIVYNSKISSFATNLFAR